MARDEFDLIGHFFRRDTGAAPWLQLGIGDDAALLQLPPGESLAVTTDTLVAGRHFPLHADAFDIGWKALAVNLSDLAAMAATPAWCTLALTLPDADGEWVDAFLDGFLELAEQHDVTLVGGDTTGGPLSITITAHGFVPEGQALRRDGARAGDEVWVTGSIGDAAGALAQWRARGPSSAKLRHRLDRQPGLLGFECQRAGDRPGRQLRAARGGWRRRARCSGRAGYPPSGLADHRAGYRAPRHRTHPAKWW